MMLLTINRQHDKKNQSGVDRIGGKSNVLAKIIVKVTHARFQTFILVQINTLKRL